MTSTTTLRPAADTSTAAAGAKTSGRRSTPGPLRAVLALPSLGFAGYLVWLAFTNICYPLRPLIGLPGYTRDSWGGPTYAGVWAVHAAGGVAMVVVVFLIARPYVGYVRHLTRRRSR